MAPAVHAFDMPMDPPHVSLPLFLSLSLACVCVCARDRPMSAADVRGVRVSSTLTPYFTRW